MDVIMKNKKRKFTLNCDKRNHINFIGNLSNKGNINFLLML